MVWLITSPFLSALALAAVIVTISSPLYYDWYPNAKTEQICSGIVSTVIVFVIGILPIAVVTGLIVNEAVDLYQEIDSAEEISLGASLTMVESQIGRLCQGLNLTSLTDWSRRGVVDYNLASIFAEQFNFLFFIALIASFSF